MREELKMVEVPMNFLTVTDQVYGTAFVGEIVKALKEFLADEELEEVIEELQRSLEKEAKERKEVVV